MEVTAREISDYNAHLQSVINNFFKEKLKECGHDVIKPSYGKLLSIVYDEGGTVQIKSICDALLKKKPTVTEMINRMIKLGYLAKTQCCKDRRVSYVTLTPKAVDFKEDFDRISEELYTKMFQGFSEEEKEKMMAFTIRLINNIH